MGVIHGDKCDNCVILTPLSKAFSTIRRTFIGAKKWGDVEPEWSMRAQSAPQIINTFNPKVCHRSPSLKFLRSNHLFRGVISHFCITPRISTLPGTLVRTLQATSRSCSWYKKLLLMPATTLERSCVCGHPPPPGQKNKQKKNTTAKTK